MAGISNVMKQGIGHAREQARPIGSLRFDWLVVILSSWMIGGIHLDGWAHHHFDVETFFTPWHGVLYSGFLALAVVLVGTFIRNLTKGYHWRQAMPIGYDLSLLGVALFMIGAAGDMVWHIVFGFEVSVEALLSPTHLLLALGGTLIVTGPVRTAWQRTRSGGWSALLPVLIALALVLAVFSFFTAYANPLTDAGLAQGSRPMSGEELFLIQGLGIASILFQAGLMMGVLLAAVRRWTLPFGGLTLILAVATLLTVSVHEKFYLLPFGIIAGPAADLLYWRLKPSTARTAAFRLFAFSVPVIFYALYFATLALTGGVWWTIHLWAGSIVMAGLVGWLLSYAFVSPAVSNPQPEPAPIS